MLLSFLFFLLLFASVGISSAWKSRGTKQDYYIASGAVKPWLVGLSAVATNNSGYMFIGVIGYTYATGLASIWLMIGWITGDFLASLYVHRRLNRATTMSGEVSYPGVLSNWYGQEHILLQRLAGLISLAFLFTYAGAQLVAGSKALNVLLDLPFWAGAVVAAILIGAYCLAGGIRASIWTDAAQSIVMIGAMSTLLFVAVFHLGGPTAAVEEMGKIEGFLDWFPKELALPGLAGGLLFILGWLFAGMSVIGQPHVMVRFMSLDDTKNMRRAKLWYYLWFTFFYAAATAVGMLSRVYLVGSDFDAELALPMLALEIMPEFFVGVILAGVFAATMSTADSLILSCSAAITHDILPHKNEKTWILKVTTVLITLVALGLALLNNQSVFNMVIMSWSGLASAFAPLLIVLCLGARPKEKHAIAAMIIGFMVALFWRLMGWHALVYEGLPGIIAGFLILVALPSIRKEIRQNHQLFQGSTAESGKR